MKRELLLSIGLLLVSTALLADDGNDGSAATEAAPGVTNEAGEEQPAGASPERPKTMSGMSILGNEEAPKSLVIIPWKSSRLGDDLELAGLLDERAKPVDREVFIRELSYYQIRSGG
jgi:hypothetical protein